MSAFKGRDERSAGVPLGSPIALPAASSTAGSSSQVTAGRPGNRAPKDSPSARHIKSQALGRAAVSLSQRDLELLVSIGRHRFLTTRQVEALHFADHASPVSGARTARRVLRRLCQCLLISPLGRRVGGERAGSAAYVWRLASAGQRLLVREGLAAHSRRAGQEPGQHYLFHCLAVADVHVALRAAERQGRFELARVQLEPDCWRAYLGSAGERLRLKPDLFVITRTAEFQDHWFIEVDRGTESTVTVLKQCARYEAYRRTGLEQHQTGVFPLVVLVCPDERRQSTLAGAIQRSHSLTQPLYRVTTQADVVGLLAEGAS